VGLFKVFFLYVVIVPGFALTAGLMSGLGYWAGQGDDGARAIQMSALIVLLAASMFAVLGLSAFPVFEYLFDWNEATALAFAAALFGSIAGGFFEEAAIARGRTWTGAIFYSSFELIRTGAIILAALHFRSLEAVFVAHAGIVTLKAVSGYLLGYRLGIVRLRPEPPVMRAVVRYAFPVSMAWVFGIFVGYTDQLVLSTWISPAEFAFYSIGCLSVAPLLIIEQSITRVLIPELSRAFADRRSDDAARLFQDGVRHLGFVMIPATVGLFIFAEPIIQLLFTQQYGGAAPYLRLFAFSYLCFIVPHDAVARARGQAGWILKNFVAFSVPTVLCTVLGLMWGGAMGALGGMLIARFMLRAYAVYYVVQSTGWAPHRFLPIGGLARMGLYAGFLGLMMWGMRSHFETPLSWFLVCGALFTVLYLPGAFLIQGCAAIPRSGGRVLVVTQRLSIGGLERMVLNLCTHLKAEGAWDVRVLAYDHPAQGDRGFLGEFEALGIPVKLHRKGNGFSPRVVVTIVRSIARERIAVVHTHDLGGLIYGALAKCIVGGRVKLVHTQHSFVHLGDRKRYAMYERIFARFADELSVVSDDTREQYIKFGLPEERIHLIENGVEFVAEPRVLRSEKIELRRELMPHVDQRLSDLTWVVYVARLFPGKGQDRAIELWSALSPGTRANLALILVGPESAPGEWARLQRLISEAPDGARIILAGASSTPERWLQAGDVYLSCSAFEGMPLGPLEAVGAGLPTVLSSIPGHEFLKPLSAQFPLDDIGAGVRALTAVVQEVQRRGDRYHAELWVKNRWIRDRFSIAGMGERYARLYGKGEYVPGGAV
jgi:O-antigen/teichoic acid export membrane protein/glycosyltransferase involved in cell wall biosynthesis